MSEPGTEPDPIEAWLAATEGHSGAAPTIQPGSGPPAPRISRRLLVLTAIPWLVAAALGVAALAQVEPPAPRAVAASAAPSPQSTATPAPALTASSAPAAATAPESTGVAAAAIVAVRLGTGSDAYLDTAVVEDTVAAGPGTVVTVRSVVLDRTDSAWSPPREVRHRVVVGPVDGEVVALSPAWEVAPPAIAAPAWDWDRIDDPALLESAVSVVRANGYTKVTPSALRRSPQLPDITSFLVDAVAPGAPARAAHEVWLTADAAAVLGSSAATPDLPVPAEQP